MMKSDKSIHGIVLSSIRRSTKKPYSFRWTHFYESNDTFIEQHPEIEMRLNDTELIVCATVIDKQNFSILTTQRLITRLAGVEATGSADGSSRLEYGDFKGYAENDFTFGRIRLKNGTEMKYFIETGNASMVMIYGVKTLLQLNK